ncbi:MAG: FHA domain-containing protein [Myxococcales bacterium]
MLPLVVTVESASGQKRRYAFADSPVRIGRSPLAELQLSEAFVSRWQGTVRFDDRGITYCNVSSTNVTFVGDREAAAHDELTISAEVPLRIGGLILRFSREPVPEADVRRKGKHKPAVAQPEVAKTMWLGADDRAAFQAVQAAVQAAQAAKAPAPTPEASPSPAQAKPSAPAPARTPAAPQQVPPGVQISAQRIIGLQGDGTQARVSPRSEPAPTAPPSSPSESPAARPRSEPAPARSAQPPVGRETSGDPEWHYANYRSAWSHLFAGLSVTLEAAGPEARQAIADDMQRRYPQIAYEAEFRELLKRHGIEPRKIDIPEISAWLRGVAEGILPPKFHLDTGLTLQRVLALLEVLSQSFAEINDAQQSVRARWLGRAPRASVIRSDDGRVVLAYLLNPKGDWEERLGELEEVAREVVVHEFALFKATLGGARELLETLSPAAIAEAEGIDPAEIEQSESSPGLWKRISSRDGPEQRLWRRFVAVYEGLVDGDRYQRAFLGRAFARTYLSAMGSTDTNSGSKSQG